MHMHMHMHIHMHMHMHPARSCQYVHGVQIWLPWSGMCIYKSVPAKQYESGKWSLSQLIIQRASLVKYYAHVSGALFKAYVYAYLKLYRDLAVCVRLR